MVTRRSMIIATTAMVPVLRIGKAAASDAGSEQLKQLDGNYPAARALNYVEDATQSQTSLYPKGAAQRCGTCLHWQGGSSQRGACGLFEGFSVAAAGWCSGWVDAARGG